MLVYYSNLQHNNWLDCSSAYNRTRQRYISHIANAVAALLKIVSRENVVEICQSHLSSKAVDNSQWKEPTITSSLREVFFKLSQRFITVRKAGNKAEDAVNYDWDRFV